jgi:hypothetical protein
VTKQKARWQRYRRGKSEETGNTIAKIMEETWSMNLENTIRKDI